MSDEQTRLLQQILEVQTQHLAFAKQNSEDFKVMQRTALEGQRRSLRMSRFVILFMVFAIGAVVALSLLNPFTEKPAADIPAQKFQ